MTASRNFINQLHATSRTGWPLSITLAVSVPLRARVCQAGLGSGRGRAGRWDLRLAASITTAFLMILPWLVVHTFANADTNSDWPFRTQAGPFLVAADHPVTELDTLADELLQLSARLQSELAIPIRLERIRLYLFHDRELFEAFLLHNMPQLTPRDINRQGLFFLHGQIPVIVAYVSPDLRRTLRHEFTHAVLNCSVPGLPLWLDEGLAMYYETPDGSGWQERLAEQLQQAAKSGWQPNLSRLESLTRMQQMGVFEYAEAWSWTFLLLHGGPEYRACLRTYLADLGRRSKPRPLSQRWTVPGQPPEKSWLAFYGWTAPSRPRIWHSLRQWLTR